MRNKFFLLLFIGLFLKTISLQAQVGAGELGNFDCTYSKEIILPFDYAPAGAIPISKPMLNQTVFYSYRDQFSYWYKIIAKENSTLSFKVTPINDSDTYVVYVFRYNKNDFCDQVYYGKIHPVKSSFFKGGGAKKTLYDLTEKSFAAKKDNTYYISVLNTSLNNCGHSFYLINGNDTLKVKALHLPCKRDVSTLVTKIPSIIPEKKNQDTLLHDKSSLQVTKDDTTLSVVAVPPENNSITLTCFVKDSKKKIPVSSKLSITDRSSAKELEVNTINKGEFNCTVEKGKNYKLRCSSIGYKDAEQNINANQELQSKNNKVEILLEPLKAGDNFVMRRIYFHPNTYALKRESSDELKKLLDYLLNNENIKIEIQGHTNGDNHIYKNKAYSGLGQEWNFKGSAKKLSQKRAEAIKNYLVLHGVKKDRLVSKGFGGSKMIVKNVRTMEEGQKNIRVEVVILKE